MRNLILLRHIPILFHCQIALWQYSYVANCEFFHSAIRKSMMLKIWCRKIRKFRRTQRRAILHVEHRVCLGYLWILPGLKYILTLKPSTENAPRFYVKIHVFSGIDVIHRRYRDFVGETRRKKNSGAFIEKSIRASLAKTGKRFIVW